MARFNLSKEDLEQHLGGGFDGNLEGAEEFVPEISKESNELGELLRLNTLLKQYEEMSKRSGVDKWFVPGTPFGIENLPKHKAFFDAGATYKERLFMAANRIGKTVSGAFEASCHATGVYPKWWQGKRFDRPTYGWAMGSTARATRDTVQKELIGPVGAWGTGMIPKDKLGKYWALSGVPQGIDIIQVKHISGGWSTIGFKNYEQPIEAFYGTDQHWIWADEIAPINVYNECLVRTMTTKGIAFVTFTPLKGITPLVANFLEQADYLAGAKKIVGIHKTDEDGGTVIDTSGYKAIIQAGWDDAPWLDKEETEQILEASEPHLRETRRTGIPSMGSGNVYPMSLESMAVEPFEIPRHWKRLYALDVGWNRTAVLWGALDPNTDTLYVYDEHYMAEQPPAVHAASIRARGEWIPGVIDPASRGRSQADGNQLWQMYRDQGLRLAKANNAVEAGIQEVWQRMTGGRIKFFSTLHNFAKEYVLYRRDEKGRIIKENDHLMDALRYLQLNLSRAKSLDQMVRRTNYSGAARYNI